MIEIVSIGAELLTGQTLNTNAATLAKALLKEGYSVQRVVTVADRHDAIKEAIEAAMSRAPFVITTGGLGPTRDDITRRTLAEVFETKLTYDEGVARELKKRYGDNLETLKDQATVIQGAEIVPNPLGTAPGFLLKKGGKTVAVLPGVPVQMEGMLHETVLPYLIREMPREHFQKALYLLLMSEQHVDPYLRELEIEHPQVDIGICPAYGTLSLYLQTQATSQEAADAIFAPVLEALRTKFKDRVFSETEGQIESAVHETLRAAKKTLALAESCTGGRMAARLTQISGASDYFLGSLVTYSNHLKEAVLQVSAQTLQEHGAVSEETVREMLHGTLALSGADYAVAVSGVAGPTGGTPEKPVGTVWGGIATKEGGMFVTQFLAKGKEKRSLVIEYSVTFLLGHLWRFVKLGIPPFEAS